MIRPVLYIGACLSCLLMFHSCQEEEEVQEEAPLREKLMEKYGKLNDPFAKDILMVVGTAQYDSIEKVRVPYDYLAQAIRWPDKDSSYSELKKMTEQTRKVWDRQVDTLRAAMNLDSGQTYQLEFIDADYSRQPDNPMYKAIITTQVNDTKYKLRVKNIWIVNRKKYLDVNSEIFLEHPENLVDTTLMASDSLN